MPATTDLSPSVCTHIARTNAQVRLSVGERRVAKTAKQDGPTRCANTGQGLEPKPSDERNQNHE